MPNSNTEANNGERRVGDRVASSRSHSARWAGLSFLESTLAHHSGRNVQQNEVATVLRSSQDLLSVFHHLWLLIDPVELGRLPALNLFWLEPQSNLLLGTLDTIRAVANVATDIDGIITTNRTRGGLERVGCTEDGCAVLAASHGGKKAL